MYYRSITFFSLFLLVVECVYGQGCSDAGFCTMGAMKPDQPFNKKLALRLRSMELSFYRGTTSLSPVIYVGTADFNFSLNKKTALQIKLPYQSVTGSLGNTGSLGDISLCITRTIFSNEHYDINFSLGSKLPTNNSNLKEDGKPLPMYYQTSLGTFDGIVGISLISKKWLLATGVQHPFNRNKNEFTWAEWEDYPNQEYLLKYNQSNHLKRGTDVMVRIERNFRFSRVNFSLGLLPIYRVTNDEITDPVSGNSIVLEEGKGLALSGIATAGYQFNVRSGVKLLFGRKMVQREKNPDGLTREVVSTISYFYRF